MPHTYPHVTTKTAPDGTTQVTSLQYHPFPQEVASGTAKPCEHNALPGMWWPTDAKSEEDFLADMRSIVEPSADFDRIHVTNLMSCLRNSTSLEELLEVLPGISIAKVLGAYEFLHAELQFSLVCWWQLLDGERDRVAVLASKRLLPVATRHILQASSPVAEEAVMRNCTMAREAVNELFSALNHMPAHSIEGVTLGRSLFRGHGYGLFGDPFFVPERVGELSPERVAAIWSTREHDV